MVSYSKMYPWPVAKVQLTSVSITDDCIVFKERVNNGRKNPIAPNGKVKGHTPWVTRYHFTHNQDPIRFMNERIGQLITSGEII